LGTAVPAFEAELTPLGLSRFAIGGEAVVGKLAAKPRNEHMLAGLPPIADIAHRDWHDRKVPEAAVSTRSSAGPYSITSSASASSDGGTVTPSILAV
jgi:hypothetical protein